MEELAAALRAEGAQAAALSIDLSKSEAGDVIERTLSDRGLYCDVLVNSAGFGLFGAAAELDRAEQLNLLDVNARALIELTLRFIPGMVTRGRGGILNVDRSRGSCRDRKWPSIMRRKTTFSHFQPPLRLSLQIPA